MSCINTLIGESRSILGKVLDYCKETEDFEIEGWHYFDDAYIGFPLLNSLDNIASVIMEKEN